MDYEEQYRDRDQDQDNSDKEEVLDIYQIREKFLDDYLDAVITIYDRLHASFPYIFVYGNSYKLTEFLLCCYGLNNSTYKKYSKEFKDNYKEELENSFYIVNTYLISSKRYYKTLPRPILNYDTWCDFCFNIM
jgi:hypothetical protein